jgi:hypothetical protein
MIYRMNQSAVTFICTQLNGNLVGFVIMSTLRCPPAMLVRGRSFKAASHQILGVLHSSVSEDGNL